MSVQETKSLDVPNLELKGLVFYGNKHGYAKLLVPEQFCTIKRSWKSEERCTAILFGTTMEMAVICSTLEEESGNVRGMHLQCG